VRCAWRTSSRGFFYPRRLFVTQGFDRLQARGARGRVDAEEQPSGHRRQARQLDPAREILETIAPVTALGDSGALKQLLLILLDNAIKYTHGAISIEAGTAGGQAVIAVRDEGPGMPPEALQRIFDRFYRGDVDPAVPGFGLGLPIARTLVESQGDTITISSQPGEGSTVRIFLPLAE
jgi:signal transduction histidine kinase